VSFAANFSGALVVPASSGNVPIICDTLVDDTNPGAFNVVTGTYTVPVSGMWSISYLLYLDTTGALPGNGGVNILNGAAPLLTREYSYSGSLAESSGTVVTPLTQGDVLTYAVFNNAAGTVTVGVGGVPPVTVQFSGRLIHE
jgi:hypothetical protein